MSATPDAIVVGGGCAGIAGAMNLAQAGLRVRLIETRRKLGGRATSFRDVRTGLLIDNCQHVVMGCCTNYLDLCARLGVLDLFEWHDTTYWLEAGGRLSTIRSTGLPEPGHLAPGFLGASFLNTEEKLAIARAMAAMLFTDRKRHAGRTFADWLASRNQPASAIHKLWEPVIISACNLTCHRVSASVALHVFQEGFLANRVSPTIGLSRVPLVELYDRAETVIVGAGGSIDLGTSVTRVGETFVETSDGERIEAGRVICAVPFERALKIVDADVQTMDARFASMRNLSHSPILGVHLVFDRPVMSTPHAVLVGRETHWLFRKDEAGAHVHAVISCADAWMGMTEEQITGRVRADIEACIPEARDATILSSRPVKEKRATYVASPEGEAARPATMGESGLILAGDYVRSGWPATMEGAVRSGYLASEAALDGAVTGRSLAGDIPARGLARFVMS